MKDKQNNVLVQQSASTKQTIRVNYAAFTVLFCLLQRKYITYYKYYLYYTINHNDMRLWLLTLSNLAHKTS